MNGPVSLVRARKAERGELVFLLYRRPLSDVKMLRVGGLAGRCPSEERNVVGP